MKTRVSSIVALVLTLILVEGPLLDVAYALQKPSLSKASTAALLDIPTSTRSSAPFVSKLLSKRPAQVQNTGGRVPGQTITTLPDGRQLMTGGLEQEGPVFTITIEDARTATSSVEPVRLQRSRAFHTATMLPDGKILILGGIGGDGRVADTAEIYDPEFQTSELLEPARPRSSILDSQSSASLTPRVYHTATLLTEGIVLIAGGVSNDGEALKTAELWDFRAKRVVAWLKLRAVRFNHTATLLPDGNVLLLQGSDKDNRPLANGELFEPGRTRFSKVKAAQVETLLAAVQSETLDPKLTGSIPGDGATGVTADALLALRFSKPLRAETVSSETITLSNSYGAVETRVIPAEGGRLAFVTPSAPLLPATSYTLSQTGSEDSTGHALPPVALSFTTAAAGPAQGSVEGEQWLPDADYLTSSAGGEQSDSSWQKLASLQAAAGVTALAGQVLKLNGKPLARVTIEIDGDAVGTDETGRFLLPGVQAGHRVMMIHGHTANKPGKTYGMFEVGVDIKDRQTNSLPYTIWLPVIDNQHATRLSVPTSSKVIARTPHIPDLEVHIPERVRLRNDEGDMTSFSITPIPADRPPFPGPKGAKVFFALQTHGARVESVNGNAGERVEIIFPNVAGAAPGSTIDLFSYSAKTGWHNYGQGEVTKNGKQIKPLPGTTPQSLTCLWAALSDATEAPGTAPAPGSNRESPDPVDLGTGLFMLRDTDLLLPDVMPVALTRVYRPLDTRSRPFGIGATHPYQMFIVGEGSTYSYVELILPDGGRIRYERISPGTTLGGAVLEHTATPTQFYKSKFTWNSDFGWTLQFKDGSQWKFYAFDGGPALISMSDRLGNTVTIDRASYKRINRVLSPNGRWIEFTYDSSDRVTQAKDNIGRTVGYTYDGSGRLWKVTNPLGHVTEYTYDSSHRMLTIKDARGIVYVTNQYDANGRISLQTQGDGTTYQFAYILDTNGKVTQTDMTDPRGNVYRVTFNSKGYALTDTFAVGTSVEQTVTHQRQANTNFLQSVTDALNRRTDFSYDSLGNLTSITRLAGTSNAVTTGLTYEPVFNQLTSVTDPLNHTSSIGYDSKGNPTSVTDPLGNQAAFAYNSAGQAISATSPINKTMQFGYDGGDLASMTNPLGQSVNRFVDSAGRVLSVRDPHGQTTKFEYDALNRLTRVTDPLQGATSFAYDPNGNLLSVTDARSNAITYAYDNMDRVQTRTDPLGRASSYQYNDNGSVNQITDRKNQVTNYTYDALERLTQVTYADASTTSYTYDGGSRFTQIADSLSGTISYTYDDLDRVTSEATSLGTVSYSYDAAGRRTTMSVPGQAQVAYSYDNANRLIQITQGSSIVIFAYDAASRTTSQTLPNGVVTEYRYDDASRLTGLTYKKGANVLGNLTYEYDAAGRRTRIGGSLASTGVPQAVSTTSYNAANHQTGFGGQALSYDNNGNLTGDGINTYTWNARDQLVSMSGPGLTASFQYDALGRRRSKTINGNTVSFLYDGWNIVQEHAGGSATANLLTGGVDNLFTRSDSSGTTTALRDALGSSIALTDLNGSIQTQYSYEPFGKTTTSGTTTSNTQRYTGREDDETGLYCYRSRYYSPSFQRFISEDRIGLRGGINLFAYVENNPVSLNDPFGFKPSDPWISEEEFCGFLGRAGSAAAGFGDALTGGLTDKARDWTGADGAVDKGCGYYTGGEYGAYAWALGTGVAIAWELLGAEVVAVTVLKGPIPNVTAQSLAEKLALEEAMANGGSIIITKLGDAPRLIANYGEGEWVKMRWVHPALDGSKIVVHWFRNLTTGQNVEYKFK